MSSALKAKTMRLRITVRSWRSRIVIGLTLALVGALGYEVWDRPARRAAHDARTALATGRYDQARAAVERWVALRPRSGEAQYVRAKVGIAQSRSRDISEGMKAAQASGYPETQLAVLRALIDAQHGRLAQARPVLAEAFATTTEPDRMLYEALARVYLETYDFGHAGAILDRWAKDAPDDVRPPLWHASVHRRRNIDHAIILDDYREALRRSPDNPDARLGLAEELEQLHRNDEAADAYRALLALRPSDPAGQLGAGRNALALGNEPDALRHLDRAVELDPGNPAARLEHAKLDLRKGDPAAALTHLDHAIARAPADATAHYQRSLALRHLGRESEAGDEQKTFKRLQLERQQLDELLEQLGKSPGNVTLQVRVAQWMFQHAYGDEAVQWCRKILTDTPGQPETCLLLAEYHEHRGEVDQAEAYRALTLHRQPAPTEAGAR